MNALAIPRVREADVRIVVANNDGGGIFEFLPQAEQVTRDEFEAVFGTPLGLDFERVAGLFGLRYARVDDLADLGGATEDPGLVEVRVDRRKNVVLHKRLTQAATNAVQSSLG
jgi:2-succinyl-5-enolpyruvyl-6-hydroxy-3-cyclohexene-1-carboxylate synthase